MPTLITNIKNSLLTDAINLISADEVILIEEIPSNENIDPKDRANSPIYNLTFPDDVKMEIKPVARDDLKQAAQKLDEIVSDEFENGSEVCFALEGNLLGLQILEAAKKFNIKKVYVIQAGKLDEFQACYIKGL
ncbi:MAG TPA: hypothetical protein PL168_06110 [Methanobacterium sp.]|nr:hypothetical protein [Methanobacterium sp.]